MRIQLDRLASIKNWIHTAQGILLFLAWALTIGVFTQPGSSDGRTGWFFGLCWLTIPILIYLTMVPSWPRARKFANVYAFAALDAGSIILWLSAWAAVASYVASGKGQGTDTKSSGCDNFKFGSASRCRLSEATIVFGVFIMVLFIPTSYVSFKAVMEYSRTGVMPTGMPVGMGAKPVASVDDEAFDSNMNARNDWEVEEYEHEHDARQGGGHHVYQRAEMHEEDEYTSAMAHSRQHSEVVPAGSYEDLNYSRPVVPGGPLGHEDTVYRPGGYR